MPILCAVRSQTILTTPIKQATDVPVRCSLDAKHSELKREFGAGVAFNIVTYTGYGLLLAALISFAALKGITTSAQQGLIWGLCGFIAVQLAPAIGLPPELPGTIAAEVGQRQLWWISTILASATGLGLIAFGRSYLPLAGVILIAIPQLLGAPHLDMFFGVAPPELAAEFATLSLGAAAAGWVMLGYVVAATLTRLET